MSAERLPEIHGENLHRYQTVVATQGGTSISRADEGIFVNLVPKLYVEVLTVSSPVMNEFCGLTGKESISTQRDRRERICRVIESMDGTMIASVPDSTIFQEGLPTISGSSSRYRGTDRLVRFYEQASKIGDALIIGMIKFVSDDVSPEGISVEDAVTVHRYDGSDAEKGLLKDLFWKLSKKEVGDYILQRIDFIGAAEQKRQIAALLIRKGFDKEYFNDANLADIE